MILTAPVIDWRVPQQKLRGRFEDEIIKYVQHWTFIKEIWEKLNTIRKVEQTKQWIQFQLKPKVNIFRSIWER